MPRHVFKYAVPSSISQFTNCDYCSIISGRTLPNVIICSRVLSHVGKVIWNNANNCHSWLSLGWYAAAYSYMGGKSRIQCCRQIPQFTHTIENDQPLIHCGLMNKYKSRSITCSIHIVFQRYRDRVFLLFFLMLDLALLWNQFLMHTLSQSYGRQ